MLFFVFSVDDMNVQTDKKIKYLSLNKHLKQDKRSSNLAERELLEGEVREKKKKKKKKKKKISSICIAI